MIKFGIVIPLRPKSESTDWSQDCKILKNTIQSLLQQSYSNIIIYVVYSDIPIDNIENNKVKFIQSPWPFQNFSQMPFAEKWITEFGSEKMIERRWDKGRKISYGCMLAKNDYVDYIMAFDSDDILSKYFLKHSTRM
jgi:cellulose synthase/poly-beta-1,6-N-acetylglucosamine synthase-like glycosyltransferase